MRGHIVKRSEDSWSIVLSLGRDPVTGKRRQQWVTIKGTKRDAERRLTELLHTLETGGYVKPEHLTVGEFLERWLRDYVATNTAPSTSVNYVMICRHHFMPSLSFLPLMQLKPQHLQSYYAEKLKAGLSPRTVLHHHRVIYEALKHAVKWGLVARNVAEAVDAPCPVRPQMNVMTPDDVPIFLEAAKGSPFRDFFFVKLFTGMRRGELLGLRWRDVDLEMANVSVTQSLQRLSGHGFIFGEPKSAKGRRQVALPSSAALVLRDHRKQAEAAKALLGMELSDDDLVFGHVDGSPQDPSSITHAFMRIARKAGLKGIRLHDLRHTHASLMLKQGVHPKIVSERLGHSTISITLDTYSHVLPGLQEAAALRFEEGLGLTADVSRPATGRLSAEKIG